MSILLRVERESGGQPIELGDGKITGYSYINTSPADFLAKAYNAEHSIQIRGEIPLRPLPPVGQDVDNSNTLYAWALTEYRPDNDYYRTATVRIVRHEKTIREVKFTHAYVHGYNEQVNGWKGTLEFELILRQKRDQLDSIRCSSGSTIQDLTNKKEKRVSLLAYSGSTPFGDSSQYQSMNVLKDAVLGTLNNTKDWVTEKADQARNINSTLSGMDSGYKMLIGDDINTLLDPNLAPKEKAQELVGIPVFGKLNGFGKGMGKVIPKVHVVSEKTLDHANIGDFTRNPRTGEISKMSGGGHGQDNIDFLEKNGIEYNIEKTYSNGVRVGNVPDHKSKGKRTGSGQAWFPEKWSREDIRKAGEHVANMPEHENAADGVAIFGEYNGVRVGVIKTDGEIGTIFPDNMLQP